MDDRALLDDLRSTLGARLRHEPLELRLYERDAGVSRGEAAAVCFPESIEELAAVVGACARHDRPFVARGSGTGLAGGATPVGRPVVIVTTRMNRILEVDVDERVAWVEPGVLNLDLSKAVAPSGLHYAPDPSSQQACTIGGNVGTNAGGPHCLASGVTEQHVLAVDVVLGDGSVVRLGGLEPDHPGYDLRGCFVGSEGTMGVTGRIAVRLTPDPPAIRTLLLAFGSVEAAAATVGEVIAAGIVPAALEMMDGQMTRAVEAYVGAGYPADADVVLLVELDGLPAAVEHDVSSVQEIARRNETRSIRVASSDEERALLWKGRKSAFGAVARIAPDYYLHDAVVPRTRLVEVLRRVYEIADEHRLTMMNVFHAGDGNLHPLIVFDAREPGIWERVNAAGDEILRACVEVGGVLSGEHGIGLEKRDAMTLVFGPDDLEIQARVRDAFDPSGRANPMKILPTGEPLWRDAPGAGGDVDLTRRRPRFEELARSVAEPGTVVAVGARTHWEVGGAPQRGREVRAPSGVVAYDPAELTVTVGAGTTVRDLAAVLAEAGQECPLDPRSESATVGGTLAAGLSGHRRLGHGPLRNLLLEAWFVTADGRVVRAGGPTVKNVTGYDLPRLLVGSLGTLGVLAQVTLRCKPCARATGWWTVSGVAPLTVLRALFRPCCVAWDGEHVAVLLEGDPEDLDAQACAAGLLPGTPPSWPVGAHRGRASVRPGRVGEVLHAVQVLPATEVLAEVGVGTVHVACGTEAALGQARRIVEEAGGWLLREAGAPGMAGFGRRADAGRVAARVKRALDPTGKLAPGRIEESLDLL